MVGCNRYARIDIVNHGERLSRCATKVCSIASRNSACDSLIVGLKSSQASSEVEQLIFSPSMELDTIDLLDGHPLCSLVIRPGGYQIEVAKGQVHPEV